MSKKVSLVTVWTKFLYIKQYFYITIRQSVLISNFKMFGFPIMTFVSNIHWKCRKIIKFILSLKRGLVRLGVKFLENFDSKEHVYIPILQSVLKWNFKTKKWQSLKICGLDTSKHRKLEFLQTCFFCKVISSTELCINKNNWKILKAVSKQKG